MPDPSQLGVFVPQRQGLPRCLDVVREAEARGLGAGAWFGEPGLVADSLVTSAAGAAVSSKLPIGISMVSIWRMLPAALASAVRGIEDVAPGRLSVTLGPWHEPTATSAGARRGSSVDGLIEATAIVRRLLGGERVSVAGREFTVADAALDRAPVTTPLLWGVMGPRLTELAGAHADGVALNYAATTDRVHEVVSAVRRGCEDAGKDPDELQLPAHVFTFVSGTTDVLPDEETAVERWRSLLEAVPVLRHEAGLPDGPVSSEEARMRAACGSAERVSARLDEYLDAGATSIVLCDISDVIAAVDAIVASSPAQ
jgi:alkanesulfonate monooxygenase SsuD/methylene tetrahydromethanopterin reductase-like flavin-dependent oxidoreductase (luciferase family)